MSLHRILGQALSRLGIKAVAAHAWDECQYVRHVCMWRGPCSTDPKVYTNGDYAAEYYCFNYNGGYSYEYNVTYRCACTTNGP